MVSKTTWENVWQRFYSKTRRVEGGCLLWTGAVRGDGYGAFQFDGRQMGAHRAAWLLNRGEIPKGMQVLHQCDTPLCVDHEHLYVGTVQDNVDDRMERGRHVGAGPGEAHWNALLTEEDILAIRASKEVGRRLAERYGVSPATISMIRTKKIWRHVG